MNLFASQILSLVLRGRHAGDAALVANDPVLGVLPRTLTLRSDAFSHRGALPVAQGGRGIGDNRSPDLSWDSLPSESTSWLLVLEDPDVPLKKAWVHAIATGPADMTALERGALRPSRAPAGVRFGPNTGEGSGYDGPRPLPGHGPHRYVFQLFALRSEPSDAQVAGGRDVLVPFLREVAIACGRLDGVFQRDWRGRPIAPPRRTASRRNKAESSLP